MSYFLSKASILQINLHKYIYLSQDFSREVTDVMVPLEGEQGSDADQRHNSQGTSRQSQKEDRQENGGTGGFWGVFGCVW